MIIFSESKLEIGKIYGDNTIKRHQLRVQGKTIVGSRFMVLRESNEKEYLEYYKEKYGEYPKTQPFFDNFYLISVD